MQDSTIAAIATARGEAALSIVRVSGPEAIAVAAEVFRGSTDLREAPSHTAWFGRVYDAEARPVDQVVATIYRAPRSFTGEDLVELTCHGGDVAPAAVLAALYEKGAAPAEPGEFTRRAFVNGKMDLEQAEAVIDLIHSRSVASHRVALRQLEGRFKERLGILRDDLLEVCGLVELELDFSEEDVEFAERSRIESTLGQLRTTVADLLKSAELTNRWRDGVLVVIGGRPNAGKSTLLNALVGSDRVIVSSTPGTTRDYVEVPLHLDGLLIRLVDTAGVRETVDSLEREGVRRTDELFTKADILVWVYDGLRGLESGDYTVLENLKAENRSLPVVLVANKADRWGKNADLEGIHISALNARKQPEKLEALLEEIRNSLPPSLRDYEASDGMINDRHRRHLVEIMSSVEAAERALAAGVGGELLAIELRSALDGLGSITGEITNEDILGEVFSRFCIGK